jgi:hypothetical protein
MNVQMELNCSENCTDICNILFLHCNITCFGNELLLYGNLSFWIFQLVGYAPLFRAPRCSFTCNSFSFNIGTRSEPQTKTSSKHTKLSMFPCVLQVKMAAMACVPTMRTRLMETETRPHLSTILLPPRPMRAHLRNSACPEQNLQAHHLVAAAIVTDIVPIINSNKTATSHLSQRRRKHSTKVCPHDLCIQNVFWIQSEWNGHANEDH